MKRYYNTCAICKKMFFSDTRTGRICPACKASRPAPGEPFPWDEEERQAPPPEAA